MAGQQTVTLLEAETSPGLRTRYIDRPAVVADRQLLAAHVVGQGGVRGAANFHAAVPEVARLSHEADPGLNVGQALTVHVLSPVNRLLAGRGYLRGREGFQRATRA